jgi:hypothetical protein
MKKFALIVLITLSAAVIFNSCSSSTDNPATDTTNYFPFKSGNFWVYNSSTTANGQTANTVDSTVMMEQSTQVGQMANRLENYIDSIKSKDSYQYTNGGKLYSLISSVLPDSSILNLPSSLVPEQWVVIADNNAASWDIITIPLTNLPLNLQGNAVTLNGTITVKGQKSDKSTISIMGTDYTAQKFILNIIINGTVTIPIIPVPIPLSNFTIQSNYYYVDNIGLVKSETLPSTLDLTLTKITTPESLSTLKNYSVTK